jgi:hypothetical protein
MHFCLEGQYTPHAINQILDNPNTSRLEAAKMRIPLDVAQHSEMISPTIPI